MTAIWSEGIEERFFFQAHVAIKGNCHRETFWSLFCKMLTVSKNQRIITSGKWLLFAYMDL